MQRLLAIDCDAKELCYVLATAAGEKVTLESMGTISVTATAEERASTPEELGKQLQTGLAKLKRSGAKYLTLVDRGAIELTEITVPPASDAEVPELVHNQLSLESPNILDESVVDFIIGPGSSSEPRRITAAALARTELARINAVCNAAGFTPDLMLIRPYETAQLFLHQKVEAGGHALLVNVIADEVDLIIVDQTRPLYFRTVRLPARIGDEGAEQRLLDEIRRTLLIAPQNADVGQVIESVHILGVGSDYERLVQQISPDCAAKVELFDPFTDFILGSGCERQSSGRLIPLLGTLLGEARGGKHAIDFLHPRKIPTPPNRRRQLVLAATVAAVLGGTGWYFVNEMFASADQEIKALKEELSDLDALTKKTAEKRKIADALDEWNANTVVWLDELRDLSTKFPPGRDIVIQRLSLNPARAGKASISFLGLARESKVVPRMEDSLRDERHEIQTPRVEERPLDKAYSWSFESAISLAPAKKEIDENTDDDVDHQKKPPQDDSKPKKSSKSRAKSKKDATEVEPPAKGAKKKHEEAENPESNETSKSDSAQEK